MNGITASEASIALGVSQYTTPNELWLQKSGRVPKPSSDNEHTKHGKKFEEPVRIVFERLTGGNIVEFCNHFKHPKYPFLGATPDGIIRQDILSMMPALVEIKCPHKRREFDFVPPEYMVQMQLQMEVMDVPMCYFVVFFHQDHILRCWSVPRSSEYWLWMKPRLLYFVDCLRDDLQPEGIPLIFHEVQAMVRRNCTFEALGIHRIAASQVPPNVSPSLIFSVPMTTSELLNKGKKRLTVEEVFTKMALLSFFVVFLLVSFMLIYEMSLK